MNMNTWLRLAVIGLAVWTTLSPRPVRGEPQDRPPGLLAKKAETSSNPSEKGNRRETYPFRGVVGAVDAAAHTVTLQGKNSRRVIAVLPETRILKDGNTAALEDLKVGEAVGGTARKATDGQEQALLIRIGPKAAGGGAAAGPLKAEGGRKAGAESLAGP